MCLVDCTNTYISQTLILRYKEKRNRTCTETHPAALGNETGHAGELSIMHLSPLKLWCTNW
jgi:hypothetical protein